MDEKFTIVDAYLFVCLCWTDAIERSIFDYKNLLIYKERIKNIECIRKAMKDECLI
jgi:hypothetical protein